MRSAAWAAGAAAAGPVCVLLMMAASAPAAEDPVRSSDRNRARQMLKTVKGELRDRYYDPAFHGLDLDATFEKAEREIGSATSLGQLMGVIAQAVYELQDSHTVFLPPNRTIRVDYGWRIQMIGDRCLVMDVMADSDAAAQGIQRGDVVLAAEGGRLTRENLWRFFYRYEWLRPQPGLTAVVQSPGQPPRTVRFRAQAMRSHQASPPPPDADFWGEVRQWQDARLTHMILELGDVAVWKMPVFNLDRDAVRGFMGTARKHKALVIDLRGNGGGSMDTLASVVGALFDRDVKIADLKGRKELKPFMAWRQQDAFAGTVVALVDGGSGSASEVLARVLQIEKRGLVVGDRTSGAVMQARLHRYTLGQSWLIFYGMLITDADVITTDGQSLEGVGVTPDVLLLPTPEDVAARRDPVLARAVALAGGAPDDTASPAVR